MGAGECLEKKFESSWDNMTRPAVLPSETLSSLDSESIRIFFCEDLSPLSVAFLLDPACALAEIPSALGTRVIICHDMIV
jgi:hypothetical protein